MNLLFFKKLLHSCGFIGDIPSRDVLTEQIKIAYRLNKEYLIKNIRKEALSLSITADSWTAKNGLSFGSITGHFLDQHFKYQNFCLDIIELQGSHTGEMLSNEIFKHALQLIAPVPILSATTGNIFLNKVLIFFSDSAANFKKAVDISEVQYGISCAAHKIQIIVKNSLLIDEKVQELLSRCRKIATHFHHSTQSNEILKIRQKELYSSK